MLLWLWCRLAVIALIRPLAGELPYASVAALKRPKTNKQTNKKNKKQKKREKEKEKDKRKKIKFHAAAWQFLGTTTTHGIPNVIDPILAPFHGASS